MGGLLLMLLFCARLSSVTEVDVLHRADYLVDLVLGDLPELLFFNITHLSAFLRVLCPIDPWDLPRPNSLDVPSQLHNPLT